MGGPGLTTFVLSGQNFHDLKGSSLFAEISDTLPYDPHKALRFLHRLADDISRPIARDDRVHIEYVPTQVVTEFLRTTKLPEGAKLDGIRYRSSRRDGGISLVLFADRRNVKGASDDYPWPKPNPWLELVGRSEARHRGRGPVCSKV